MYNYSPRVDMCRDDDSNYTDREGFRNIGLRIAKND